MDNQQNLVLPAPTWGTIELERLGSDYGGWVIPQRFVHADSLVYSAGVGEDISFDLTLMNKYGCQVFAFDPTPAAKNFVKTAVPTGMRFSFHDIGLWCSEAELQFFPARNPAHISHSIGNIQGTSGGFVAKVSRLSSIMKGLGHRRLDLFKMDIEGAEYQVIDSIIADCLDISVLCVEFHVLPDGSDTPEQASARLVEYGYSLTYIERQNFTFIRSAGSTQRLL